MTEDPTEGCPHPEIQVNCEFNRMVLVEGGPVAGFLLEVRAECNTCRMPFCFRGMPVGISHLQPSTSLDTRNAILPIHPEDDPTTGIGLPGYQVRRRA
jgi:hypothetical protein